MKIAIITPRFSISGVPLAQIRFARSLADKGFDVDLIIGHIPKKNKLPPLPNLNKIIVTKNNKVKFMLVPIMKYLVLNKPKIIFSAEDHLNIIVIFAAILTFSSVKISGSSRVTPYDTYSSKIFSKGWVLKQLMKLVMWRADVLTCVSKDMVKQYGKVFKNPKHVYAYNIVDDYTSRSRLNEDVDHEWFNEKKTPIILAAGKLAPWKGFSYLIKAIKIIEKKTDAKLIILGDGELRNELQKLINDLGLSNRIQLLGYVENSLKYFSKANIFVLSSLVEGLPNVLVESMLCGCTPVSTNCPTGPNEVLNNGKYGYLVNVKDAKDLARGINEALKKPIDKMKLEKAITPFRDTEVIKRHFKLLNIN